MSAHIAAARVAGIETELSFVVHERDDRVTLHESGLGAATRRATLELSAFNQGDHRMTAVPGGRKPTVDIQIVRLDDVLGDAFGDRRPDLLKLDTQGSEVAILTGGRRAWAPRPGASRSSASTRSPTWRTPITIR